MTLARVLQSMMSHRKLTPPLRPIVTYCRNLVSIIDTPKPLGSQPVSQCTLPNLESFSVQQLKEIYRGVTLELIDRVPKMNEKKLRQMLHVNLMTSNQAIREKRPFIYSDFVPYWADYYCLSQHFLDFAKSRDPELKFVKEGTHTLTGHDDPGEVICRLIIEFGKEVCTQYPMIFRDLYLILPRKLPILFRFLQRKLLSQKRFDSQSGLTMDVQALTDEELYDRLCQAETLEYGSELKKYLYSGQIPKLYEKKFFIACARFVADPGTRERILKKKESWDLSVDKKKKETLLQYLTHSLEEQWYIHALDNYSKMNWFLFEYIRTFPSTAFDPLSHTDQIDPETATMIYQEVGLLAAAAAEVAEKSFKKSGRPVHNYPFNMVWLPRFVDWDSWVAADDREMGLAVVEFPLSRNLLEDYISTDNRNGLKTYEMCESDDNGN